MQRLSTIQYSMCFFLYIHNICDYRNCRILQTLDHRISAVSLKRNRHALVHVHVMHRRRQQQRMIIQCVRKHVFFLD